MSEPRKLSPPWEIIEHRESFEVRTANGLTIAFVYFEDENPTRRFEMGRLTKDEARRVAANIAKLPVLLKKESRSKMIMSALGSGALHSLKIRNERARAAFG